MTTPRRKEYKDVDGTPIQVGNDVRVVRDFPIEGEASDFRSPFFNLGRLLIVNRFRPDYYCSGSDRVMVRLSSGYQWAVPSTCLKVIKKTTEDIQMSFMS